MKIFFLFLPLTVVQFPLFSVDPDAELCALPVDGLLCLDVESDEIGYVLNRRE